MNQPEEPTVSIHDPGLCTEVRPWEPGAKFCLATGHSIKLEYSYCLYPNLDARPI